MHMQKIKSKCVIFLVGAICVVFAFAVILLDDDDVRNEAISASRCLSSIVKREVFAENIIKMDYVGNKGDLFYRYKYSDSCFIDVVVNKDGLCDVLGASKSCDSLLIQKQTT